MSLKQLALRVGCRLWSQGGGFRFHFEEQRVEIAFLQRVDQLRITRLDREFVNGAVE
jgi:hypothetical protein